MSDAQPRRALGTPETVLTSPEREVLEVFLDQHREELAATLVGLTEEQARRRLVTSLTTPLGLLKHAAVVERVWFQVSLAGRTRSELGLPEDVDASFTLLPSDTVASVIADFERACEESRGVAAAYGLDDCARYNRRGPLSLRWIYVHMIGELARHAGHGDILREQVLAG